MQCSVTSIGQLMHLTNFLFSLPIEESILAPINGDTRLSCELRGNAASDLRIKWVRPDGRPLSENSYESRGELLIQNVQQSDGGPYNCQIFDSNGRIVFTAKTNLIISSKESFLNHEILLQDKVQSWKY